MNDDSVADDPVADDSSAEGAPAADALTADDSPAHADAVTKARRRARLEKVFGTVLPSTTSDERDSGDSNARNDADYLRDRPPHHG